MLIIAIRFNHFSNIFHYHCNAFLQRIGGAGGF